MANAFVQANNSILGAGPATAPTLAYASNNTAGNLLFALAQWLGAGINLTGVTDTQGNAWLPLPQLAIDGSDTMRAFYCLTCKAGANTVTFNFSGTGGTYQTLEIGEWSPTTGMLFALDQHAEGVASTTTDPASPSVTTTQANELLIGYAASNAWQAFFNTGDTNWTIRSDAAHACAFADELNTAAGAYIATLHITAAPSLAGIATFSMQTSESSSCSQAGAFAVGP